MIQNYRNLSSAILVPLAIIAMGTRFLMAQEIQRFTASDFDLKGPVQSCLVLTDYGREEFEFNKDGLLTKSVTRYNDRDYNVTYYRYTNGELSERRDEVYRDGVFDESTSIAHFYERDTLPAVKVTEQIVNYNKEFLDRYDYFFDTGGQLIRMVRTGTDGVDETRVEYSEYQGEHTTSYFLNEVLLKSVRESERSGKDGKTQRLVLTKEYINGVPDEALEMVYSTEGNLISEIHFEYSKEEKSFSPVKKITYQYAENGMRTLAKTEASGQVRTENYIYQFDTRGNWIKRINTPENTYTTRRIKYFEGDNSLEGQE